MELTSIQSRHITSQLHLYRWSVLWSFTVISTEWAGGDWVSRLRTLTRQIATAEARLQGLNLWPCSYRKPHLTKPSPRSICFTGSGPSNHLAVFLLRHASRDNPIIFSFLLYLCFLDNNRNALLSMYAVTWLSALQWWIQQVCIGLHFTIQKQTAFDVIYFVHNSGIQRTGTTIGRCSYAVWDVRLRNLLCILFACLRNSHKPPRTHTRAHVGVHLHGFKCTRIHSMENMHTLWHKHRLHTHLLAHAHTHRHARRQMIDWGEIYLWLCGRGPPIVSQQVSGEDAQRVRKLLWQSPWKSALRDGTWHRAWL